jgi:quercetin dioxygenase-like cupin family protein
MKTLRHYIYALLFLLLMGFAVSAQDTAVKPQPAGPVISHQATFPITVPGGEYDLKTLVFDFQPGAGVALHMHGGHVVATVLSGEITLTEKGTTRVLKTGESWTEDPGAPHSAANAGTADTRVAVTMLLPKGAEATKIIK